MSDVSVVLCTYNGERYLAQQVDSILRQLEPPGEIVISDDGSTDGTVELARSLSGRSSIPIKVHQTATNLGFAANFLHACTLAQGTQIAFSDQDDVWHPAKLQRQTRALDWYGARLATHGVRHVDHAGRPLSARPAGIAEASVVDAGSAEPWGNFLGMTMVFDRTLLDVLPASDRGPDPHSHGASLSHDRWIYFLATTFGRAVVLGQQLADYRQHDRQLYGGLKPRSFAERLSTKLESGHDQAGYLGRVAAHRVSLLEHGLDGGATAAAMTRRWRTLSEHYARRARLYHRGSLPGRVGEVAVNTVRGTYRSNRRNGLGVRTLVEDGTVALFAGTRRR